ncbi:MAG: TIGR01621 family pseudouridine synthase, partial [Gammaproteobacteria bacterium]|nr:TIGR01621 family pseudouridine synthase [Gammaproteobacteria bacterium]
EASGETARRGYLHAWALCFPWQGSQLRYRVSPQDGLFAREDVRACLDDWVDPWSMVWPAPPGQG